MRQIVIFCVILFSLFVVCAEDNINDTVQNESTNENIVAEESVEKITDFEIVGFSPEEAEVGDVILEIQIKNTGNTNAYDLVPIVIGRGFSTYDVSVISLLKPGQKSYLHVAGKFSEPGEILLTIKIKDKLFYETITVKKPLVLVNITKIQAEEAAKKAALEEMSKKLEELKNEYDLLEKEIIKRKNKYDLSEVNLNDLKTYIRNVESAILSSDVTKANVSLTLALSEYEDQKKNLEEAPKKPLLMILKDNALVISTIAGSIVTLFALYEILKKKQEHLYKKIKEIKIIEKQPQKKQKK